MRKEITQTAVRKFARKLQGEDLPEKAKPKRRFSPERLVAH